MADGNGHPVRPTSAQVGVHDDPVIRARSLGFGYADAEQPALGAVDLDHPRGQVLGVVGPSGAGKTWLCMLLAGLVPRTTGGSSTGVLEVDGVDPRSTDAGEVARRVSLVFEDYASQLTQITVLGEVMAPLTNRGTPVEEAEGRARRLLEELDLGALDPRKRTWELSGGQQQRLAIAAALACDPHVLVLDNVTGLLDPSGKEDIRRLAGSLSAAKTLVVVEHDLDLLVGVADRVLVLQDGRPRAHGAASELLGRAELLQDAQLRPPTVVRIAQAAGIRSRPLTVADLVDGLGSVVGPGPDTASPQPPVADPDRGDEEVAVDASGACLTYPDGTVALQDVSLRVPAARVHAVVGGNGAGKSTLLRLLCGLARPSSGRVTIGGHDTREHTPAELAWAVGTVLQDPDQQITERSVRAEIEHPLRLRRHRGRGLGRESVVGEDEIREAGERARALVGLPLSLMESDPTRLSRGHRKLVAIAGALVMRPGVLLLDEPAVALDASARALLHDLVRKLRDKGTTVVLVEHDLDLVAETADEVTLLDLGRHALTGSPREVLGADNADLLHRASLRAPRAARIGAEMGIDALTVEEIAARVAAVHEEV